MTGTADHEAKWPTLVLLKPFNLQTRLLACLIPLKLLNCAWKRMGEKNHLSQNHAEDVPAVRMVEFLHPAALPGPVSFTFGRCSLR